MNLTSTYFWILKSSELAVLIKNQQKKFIDHSLREIGNTEEIQSATEKYLARQTIKLLLAEYLGQSIADTEIIFSPTGKPKLKNNIINFNYSHSKGFFAFAISSVGNVGIDIEVMRPVNYVEKIVKRFFSPLEKKKFYEVPQSKKIEYFFLIWTRIEAYVKCFGLTLFNYEPINKNKIYSTKSFVREEQVFSICSENSKTKYLNMELNLKEKMLYDIYVNFKNFTT